MPALAPAPRYGRWRRAVSIALLLVAVLAAYAAGVHPYRKQINDDAYITLRYSRNLADGHGPYFNPGEHVEGYTNFLHMLSLAGVIRIFGPDAAPPAALWMGILAGAGAVLVAAGLAFDLLRAKYPTGAPWAALVAGGLVAVSPNFAVNVTTGLETTAFAFFLSLGCLLALARGGKGSWLSTLAFAAAALSRPEGIAIFAVHWLCEAGVMRDRKRLIPGLAVLAVVAGHWIFRWFAYDGEWLPNTYYAKSGGFWEPPWPYLRAGLLLPMFGEVGIGAAALGGWLGRRDLGRRSVPLGAAAVAGALTPFVTGTDWMIGQRLVVPYLPLLAPLVAAGWVLLLRRLSPPHLRTWTPALLCLVPGILWFLQGTVRESQAAYVSIRSEGYLNGHRELATWCRQTLKPGDGIALMDIGIVGFYCPEATILDLTGLTDRFIAKSEGPFLKKEYDPAYVLGKNPAVIVLVLGVDRNPGRLPLPSSPFYFITPIERRIGEDPEFQRRYRRPAPEALPSQWRRVIGLRAGAERIFEHDHPRLHYLLAAFRRRE